MVAQRRPGLLKYWDSAAEGATFIMSPDVPFSFKSALARRGLGFDALVEIMKGPEGAKRRHRPTIEDLILYETFKRALSCCHRLRRRNGARLKFDPEFPPWVTLNLTPPGHCAHPETIRMDSPAFYRRVFQDVYARYVVEDLEITEPVPLPNVPDAVFEECKGLWERPARAALVVLEGLTRWDRDYLAKQLSTLRAKSRRTRRPGPSSPS
jgi:hypothetical protein